MKRKMVTKFVTFVSLFFGVFLWSGCVFSSGGSQDTTASSLTGWKYNDPTSGGFQVAKAKTMQTAPGLVFIQGGTFTMGASQEDIMHNWDNIPRRVTVTSFFMDKTEVANVHYREYLFWLAAVFPENTELLKGALPDTLVWRDPLSYNEPFVQYYFRHPAYNFYPLVGVNWKQASDFCIWRSDRVNERILTHGKTQYINPSTIKTEMSGGGQDNFNTESYLMGEYQPVVGQSANKSSNPLRTADGKPRTSVKFEDGILFPEYRLPTEAEWEYAAYGYIAANLQPKKGVSNRGEELLGDKQVYAWKNDGWDNLRATKAGPEQGAFLANFKRGNGDYMGVAGGLNDNAAIPAAINEFYPNGFGLYNMCGNVNEWVADVYRPMSSFLVSDLNPFRGNDYKTADPNADEGSRRDSLGRIKMVPVSDSTSKLRRNYQRAYNLDADDGDESGTVYGSGVTTLVSDKSRVYKGGSWNDMPYWLSPGTRRYLDEDLSTATIGFRCAMSHYGAGDGGKGANPDVSGGNVFPDRQPRK